MKRLSRLVFGLLVLTFSLLQGVPAAQANLSCSDCFSVCLLRNCGFWISPECQEAYWGTCQAECQPPNCG